MSDKGKRQRPPETPMRGEAAWRAAKDAIARRNEQARKLAGMFVDNFKAFARKAPAVDRRRPVSLPQAGCFIDST